MQTKTKELTRLKYTREGRQLHMDGRYQCNYRREAGHRWTKSRRAGKSGGNNTGSDKWNTHRTGLFRIKKETDT